MPQPQWPVGSLTKSQSRTGRRTTSDLPLACGSGDARGAYGAHSTSDPALRRARIATSSHRFGGSGLALGRYCWPRPSEKHPSQLRNRTQNPNIRNVMYAGMSENQNCIPTASGCGFEPASIMSGGRRLRAYDLRRDG